MNYGVLVIAVATIISGCQPSQSGVPGSDLAVDLPATVVATAETTVTLQDGASDPAIWIDALNPQNSLILGSSAEGGLELYELDGNRVGVMPDRPIGLLDVRYNFPLAGNEVDLIVGYDIGAAELIVYTMDSDLRNLREVSTHPIKTEAEIEGLCMYVSPLSGKFYVFASGAGMIRQWELFDLTGRVAARQIRSIPVGMGAGHCTVHDRESALYSSQETVGLWQLDAEPETEVEPQAVDLVKPFGRFSGAVKGVAIYEFAGEGGYLLVSDADANRLHIYDLLTHEQIGTISIDAGALIDGVEESEGLAATSMNLSDAYGNGLLVLADDDNEGDHTNYKMVAWKDLAASLGLKDGPAHDSTDDITSGAITVSASVETTPVETYGDAADDPVVWVHPESPELSVIIGAQKKRGLNVYDLSGNLLQSLVDGRMNNVDLRYGFRLGDKAVDVLTASNRSSDSISIYLVDPQTRELVDVTDGLISTGMVDPYGLCMYKSRRTGLYYVFVNDTDGLVKQWVLQDSGHHRINAELVREFSAGSQTEGCVADDETGDLYLGEEDVGIWKYSAEPDGGKTRTLVDSMGDEGHLTADVEGMAIYHGPSGKGYLVVSNQGADNFAIYERADGNKFLGLFHIVADEATGIDGVSETDGLDISSAYLGPAFPNGAMIAQDGRNISPDERQNFKLVPWDRITAAMGLEVFSGYDPRAAIAE